MVRYSHKFINELRAFSLQHSDIPRDLFQLDNRKSKHPIPQRLTLGLTYFLNLEGKDVRCLQRGEGDNFMCGIILLRLK